MSEPIVFFDGVCNLCNGSVQFVLKREKEQSLLFTSLQSEFAGNFFREHNYNLKDDSIIFFEKDVFYVKSDAALRISRKLKAPWSWLYYFLIVPRPIRDFFYDIIARNRYDWFGKLDQCMVPTPELKHRFLD